MATIHQSAENLVCVSGNSVAVFTIGSSEKTEYKCEKAAKVSSEKTSSDSADGRNLILTSGFSPSGKYFVACDDWKQITVWKTGSVGEKDWRKLWTRDLARRGTSLTFTQNDDTVLVCNKSGDVYQYYIDEKDEDSGHKEPHLLLGHISLLFDVVLCGDDKFVATCDRDEKIRISCYPNTYAIQAFCLGHTQFVSRLVYFRDDDLLISGSGDGTLRVWDYRNGRELCMLDCNTLLEKQTPVNTNGSEHTHERESDKNESTSTSEHPEMDMELGGESTSETRSAETRSQFDARAPNKKPCVNCLVGCRAKRILAASFEGYPTVLIFQLRRDVANSVHLDLKQSLTLTSCPWDLSFDPQCRLSVLQPVEGDTLRLYALQDEEFSLEKNDENLLTVVSAVNKDWPFFQDSLHGDGLTRIRQKVCIDNLTEYIERKRLRQENEREKKRAGKRQRNEDEEITEQRKQESTSQEKDSAEKMSTS